MTTHITTKTPAEWDKTAPDNIRILDWDGDIRKHLKDQISLEEFISLRMSCTCLRQGGGKEKC